MAKPGAAPLNGDDTTREELRGVSSEALAAEARRMDESEREVLGAVLHDYREWKHIQGLTPQHFHNDDLSKIFQAMRRAPSPSAGAVSDWLRQHGDEGLIALVFDLAEQVTSLSGVSPGTVDGLRLALLKRELYHEASTVANTAMHPDIDPLEATERLIERLQHHKATAWGDEEAEASPVQSLGDLAYSYWDAVAERKNSASTGLTELDKRIGGGLQAQRLYVLLGGTGSGKTTLANQIGEHIASDGRPVFYVTSEDTPSALLAKTVARLGLVDYTAVLYGFASLQSAIDEALALVLHRKSHETLAYLHDTGALSLEQMQEQARRHFERFASAGPGVLVIDYLQRMARMQPAQNGRAETRELVTLFTMRLRAVAEELGCSVLALSSMNRASYSGKGDALASAKESGDIEYTADCILALGEDEKGAAGPGHKAMTLQLAKNRLGPANEYIKLDWQGGRQTFSGVA